METGQPYSYTGDDPVNGVDPLGLCSSNGIFLVPGACDFTSRAWVAEVEGYFEFQKTQEMEGGWAKFWGGIEDFGDTLTGNPLAYCGPGASEEAGLANALDNVAGFADGADGGDDDTFNSASESDNVDGGEGEDLSYEPSPKHSQIRPGVGAQPTNPEELLASSVVVTNRQRINYDSATGEIVVFRETSGNVYHGYVSEYSDLSQAQRNALYGAGLVNLRGKPMG